MSVAELVDVEAGRIDPSIYSDPIIFTMEMQRIFASTWVYVGHESQVAQPGDFRTTTIGTRPVILSRGEDGDLYVFENSCAHRGAMVCMRPQGSTSVHRCDYHGWTYGPDGRLLGVPFPQRYCDAVDEQVDGLRRLPRVSSYRGFVFASYRDDVPPLAEHLSSVRDYIDRFCDGGDGSNLRADCGTQRFAVDANWKMVMENVPDGYHAAATHRSMVNVVNRHAAQETRPYADSSLSHAIAHDYGHTTIGVAAQDGDYASYRGEHNHTRVRISPDFERLAAVIERELGEEVLARELAGRAITPGAHTIIYPNLVLAGIHIRQIIPIAVDRTEVTLTPLSTVGVPNELNELRLRVHEFFYGAAGFAIPDDAEMFVRTQSGCAGRMSDLLVTRGLGIEEAIGDRVVGSNTDETGIRGQYREWQRLMT